MPRAGADGTAGSTSTTTTTEEEDASADNRREAVNTDPGNDVGGSSNDIDTTPDDDTSNRESAVELDTGREVDTEPEPEPDPEPEPTFDGTDDDATANLRDAVDSDPGNETPASSGDTTPDDDTTNREAARNADPANEVDRTGGTEITESDPTGARRSAVGQDPGNDIPVGEDRVDFDDIADGRVNAVFPDTPGENRGAQSQEDAGPVDTGSQSPENTTEQDRRADRIRNGEIDPSGLETNNQWAKEFENKFLSPNGQLTRAEQRARALVDGNIESLDISEVRNGTYRAEIETATGTVVREISVVTDPDDVKVVDNGDGTASIQYTAAGLETIGANPTNEELQRDIAADSPTLGPSDIQIIRGENGEISATLSDEGLRERAAQQDVTLDPSDIVVNGTGAGRTIRLSDAERDQRIRREVALNLGISQSEVDVVRDGDGTIEPRLSDDAQASVIQSRLASQANVNESDVEIVDQNGQQVGRLTDEALRERAAGQTDGVDASDLTLNLQDGERVPELTDDAARELLKERVASETNVEESDVRVIRNDDGELVARYRPESPDRGDDPVSRVARDGFERVFGTRPPTQDDLLDGLNQGVSSVIGRDIPTQGEVSDDFRRFSSDELGVEVPTQAELLDGVRSGAEDASGVSIPTNEELTQPLQDRASSLANVDFEEFSDPESAAAAGLPVAVAEPTPVGEAAVAGIVGTAAISQAVNQAGGPVNEEISPEDLEGGAFGGGEIPVEEPTQREIPVTDGRITSEIDVPANTLREQGEISVPDSLDEGEIRITDDGEVAVPADFSGNVVIQEQVEEDVDEQQNRDDVVVRVPDEFIPDEQVTIGEETQSVDETDPQVEEEEPFVRDRTQTDEFVDQEPTQNEEVEPEQPSAEQAEPVAEPLVTPGVSLGNRPQPPVGTAVGQRDTTATAAGLGATQDATLGATGLGVSAGVGAATAPVFEPVAASGFPNPTLNETAFDGFEYGFDTGVGQARQRSRDEIDDTGARRRRRGDEGLAPEEAAAGALTFGYAAETFQGFIQGGFTTPEAPEQETLASIAADDPVADLPTAGILSGDVNLDPALELFGGDL